MFGQGSECDQSLAIEISADSHRFSSASAPCWPWHHSASLYLPLELPLYLPSIMLYSS